MGPVGKMGAMTAFDNENELRAANPFEALLPEDRLSKLQRMPDARRQEFYGRVIDGIFSDANYQQIASRAATREFDKMSGASAVGDQGGDLRGVVEEVVMNALRKRGL